MIATTTVDGVPRDLQHIANLPLSHQYKLVYNLGVLSTEDQKTAFHALDKNQRAQVVLDALIEYDKKGNNMNQPKAQMTLPQMQPQTQQIPLPPQGIGAPGQVPGQVPGQMPQMGMPQMGMPMGQPMSQPMGMPMGQPQMGQPQMGMPMGQPQMGAPMGMGMPQQQQPMMSQPQMMSAQPAPQAPTQNDSIAKLAEAMSALAAAQEKMATELQALNSRASAHAKVSMLEYMTLISFIEQQLNSPHENLMNYLRDLAQKGYDEQILQEITAGKG